MYEKSYTQRRITYGKDYYAQIKVMHGEEIRMERFMDREEVYTKRHYN